MSKVSADILRDRVKYLLFKSAFPKRNEFTQRFLTPIQETGRVGLIGGAIRDLAFHTATSFKSDLDFVIDVKNHEAFTSLLSKLNPTKNAFGGYRLHLAGLRIDFWEAKKSWVHSEKLINIEELEDLLDSTFFNLDAVIYDLATNTLLIKNGMLEDLNNRRLDINLQDNPNMDGAAIRAIRRMWSFDLYASSRLSTFITERINKTGWNELVAIDCKAFPHSPVLRHLFTEQDNKTFQFDDILDEHGGRLPRPRQRSFSFMDTLL